MNKHATDLGKLLKNTLLQAVWLIVLAATMTSLHAGLITQVALKNVGDSQIITLDAAQHGSPWSGEFTPYRYLVDVTQGKYKIEFIDSVPGFVAWSPYGSSYRLPGVTFEQYLISGVRGTTIDGWGTTGIFASTQQAAYDALLIKQYTLHVANDMTLVTYLLDHILFDNKGGVSFAMTKVSGVPEPSTYIAGLSALGMLGLFGWRNRK